MTALLDLPAMMAIAGLPCNVTVRRVSPVSGFTMAWQVPRTVISGAPWLLPYLVHLGCSHIIGDVHRPPTLTWAYIARSHARATCQLFCMLVAGEGGLGRAAACRQARPPIVCAAAPPAVQRVCAGLEQRHPAGGGAGHNVSLIKATSAVQCNAEQHALQQCHQ